MEKVGAEDRPARAPTGAPGIPVTTWLVSSVFTEVRYTHRNGI